jgi:hypothetical protein
MQKRTFFFLTQSKRYSKKKHISNYTKNFRFSFRAAIILVPVFNDDDDGGRWSANSECIEQKKRQK